MENVDSDTSSQKWVSNVMYTIHKNVKISEVIVLGIVIMNADVVLFESLCAFRRWRFERTYKIEPDSLTG